MKTEKPLLFISNDDGYEAKGINELIRFLRPLGNLVVVAPDGARSGYACAITSSEPVRLVKKHEEEGLAVYSCSGTPVDCIKLGLERVVVRKPDLVVSGINHGDNSSVNVHYSGTMGIVLEACMKFIPAIGFSLGDSAADADFSGCEKYICRIVRETLKQGLPEGTCLNVNFPSAEMQPYRGIRLCRQTKSHWANEWSASQHPRGFHYFWLTGEYVNDEVYSTDTDAWALANGYVAITPTQIDMTAYRLLEDMHYWNLTAEDK